MADEATSTALIAPRDAALATGEGGPLPDAASSGTVPSRSPSFRPGVIIAEKYVVERLIGEGGLGVVVAARHVQLEQLVAIKYLRPKAMVSATVAERFVREARLAAKIRSEHVARVYDVGTLPTGAPYMVMEYLSGMDLGRVLGATGPLPVWRAVDYVLQACDALGAAHAAGIVHRDIKPENLFITTGPNGKPLLKVLDFGISKLTSERARFEAGRAGEITLAGEIFGTPAYMSPEQLLSAHDVDGRTDVWAIGVVLYQLLSGRLPFDGESLPELCTAIVNKQPAPLGEVRADVPAELARSVQRCLSKAPDERFQTVADLRFELVPFALTTREQRVGQALRTLDAAEQGRLPTPLPDELLTRALRAAPVPTFEDDRWVATTASGVASQTPPVLSELKIRPQPDRRRRGKLLALGAAGAVAAVFGVVAVTGSGSTDSETVAVAPGGPSPPVAAVANAPTPAPAPAPTTAPTTAPTPTPSTASAPRPTPALPTEAAAAPRAPKHTAAPAGSPTPAKSASRNRPVDPNAVLNPFD